MAPDDAMSRLLEDRGISSGSECAGRFLQHYALLLKWGARINLVGSLSWEVIGPLYDEAIGAAAYYPPEARRHLDIGSGAGFPAIPLRILRPSMKLTLIERRTKRAAFLETVAGNLALEETRVVNGSLAEYLEGEGRATRWDIVSWKGLKLDRNALSLLLERTWKGSQLWMFHGGKSSLEGAAPQGALRLLRRECCAAKCSWLLSIYERI